MIKLLPDEYYSSTYKIDFKKYYAMGYRGILFDIDNTLVRHNEPATTRAIQLMEQLKAIGFKDMSGIQQQRTKGRCIQQKDESELYI